jgi:hypothetical protein
MVRGGVSTASTSLDAARAVLPAPNSRTVQSKPVIAIKDSFLLIISPFMVLG